MKNRKVLIEIGSLNVLHLCNRQRRQRKPTTESDSNSKAQKQINSEKIRVKYWTALRKEHTSCRTENIGSTSDLEFDCCSYASCWDIMVYSYFILAFLVSRNNCYICSKLSISWCKWTFLLSYREPLMKYHDLSKGCSRWCSSWWLSLQGKKQHSSSQTFDDQTNSST